MTRRKQTTPVMTIRDLARIHLDTSDRLKYTDLELLSLLNQHMREMEGRLEKARKIFRDQRAELESLKQEPLWRFGKFQEAPPDYKAEYAKRLSCRHVQPSKVRATQE